MDCYPDVSLFTSVDRGMAIVQVENVGKRYLLGEQEVHALTGINLSIEPGVFLAIAGPSGSGKSTLLNIIGCIDTPSSGRVSIAGREVSGQTPDQLADLRARTIGFIFQSFNLLPVLSAEENVEYPLLQQRELSRAERRERVRHYLGMVGLSRYAAHRPNQLSGGQRQRVALGRAIVAEAPVCLMDEPLSNLDAQLRQQMRAEIRSLQQRLGMTMVYVTHDQTEAMTMADKVVLMRGGRIEQEGSPADLYERPASSFVAGFIGAPPMNLFPVPAGVPLPGGKPPTDLWLGVRPEHIGLCAPANGLPATLEAVEYLGAESMLICRHADAAHRITVRAPGRVSLRPGEPVGLEWHPAEQHLFSRADGQRLSL